MSTIEGNTIDEHTELLERRAEISRTRLLRTIDALGARRHRVRAIGHEARRLALPLVASVVAVAALAGGGVLAIGYLFKRRRERSLSATLGELVSSRFAARPSFLQALARRTSLTLVTIVSSEVARRATKNFFDGRLPDGRLAVGSALEAHHKELSR